MILKNILYKFKEYRDNGKDIDINELIDIIKNNQKSILLDVRSNQEFNEGHLNRSN